MRYNPNEPARWSARSGLRHAEGSAPTTAAAKLIAKRFARGFQAAASIVAGGGYRYELRASLYPNWGMVWQQKP